MNRLLQAYRNRRRKQLTQEQHETEVRDLNSMYARVFKTQDGQAVLEHMVSRYMATQIAMQGDDMVTIGNRQGRSDVVNEIIQRIENN